MKALNRSTIAFWAMVCIFAAAILIQPAFPSQDGPVHLYYAQVLHDLIADSSAWGGYFVRRPGVPPYMLHDLLLIALEAAFPPLVAEKILVVLCVVLLCVAFRSLVKSLEPDAGWSTLLIFPVAMHKTLYMGFYNFSLGLGIALLVCAYWIRHAGALTRRHAALFLFGLAILAITHPVALILTLCFAALELAIQTVVAWRSGALSRGWMARRRWTLLALATGYLLLPYIALYTNSSKLGSMPHLSAMLSHAGSAFEAIWPMRSPLHQFIRLIVTAGAAALLVYRLLWDRALPCGGLSGRLPRTLGLCPALLAALAFSGACAAAFIAAPDSVNGADYFNERFAIFSFVFLLAFCATVTRPRRLVMYIGETAAILSLVLLIEQSIRVRPFAEEAARLDTAIVAPRNQRGVVLATRGGAGPPDFNFSPCEHIAAHYFRRAHAVLVNSVWLHMPITAITPRAWAAYQFLDPHRMTDFGLRHPDRLPRVDFVAAESCPPGSADPGLDRLVRLYGAQGNVLASTACVAIHKVSPSLGERSTRNDKSAGTGPPS